MSRVQEPARVTSGPACPECGGTGHRRRRDSGSRAHDLGQLSRIELISELIACTPAFAGWSKEKMISLILEAEKAGPWRKEIAPPEVHAEKRQFDQTAPSMALMFRNHPDRLLFSRWLHGEGWTRFTDWVAARP